MTLPYLSVPYAQAVYGEEEIEAVTRVLRSGNTGNGIETRTFEQRMAVLFGKKYAVMVNSGSSANLLAMELLQAKRGSEIITPLLTFSTVVAPIVQKGFVPVFVDVEPDTFVVRPEDVEAAITEKTCAIMIPSLLGNLPDLAALRDIAERYNLTFIEDSCDTVGGSFNGAPTGSFSHISTVSFYGSHIITCGGNGGMILVNTEEEYKRLLTLRGWGRASSLYGEGRESEDISKRFCARLGTLPYDNKFMFKELGYNFLFPEICVAFGNVQLNKLDIFAAKRRANFIQLYTLLREYTDLFILPRMTEGADSVWLGFAFVVRDNAPFTRQELAEYLEKCGIQTRPIFSGNLLKHSGFKKIRRKLASADYSGTDQVMRGGLILACHQGLTTEQMRHLSTALSSFIREKSIRCARTMK